MSELDTSDSVAIVALIVSLVAFAVTLTQLLQQLFATADGYRRCGEAVIGPWHRYRERRTLWWELRVETTYVTPQISLFTPAEYQKAKTEYEDVHLLNSTLLENDRCKVLRETVKPKKQEAPSSGRQHKLRGLDIEKGSAGKGFFHRVPAKPARYNMKEHELLVSWLKLLKEVYLVYSNYWPDQDSFDQKPTKRIANEYEKEREPVAEGEQSNLMPTNAAATYRVWNWDLMPPDMTRPLAESTLSDIMILAMRMGMQWRTLNPEIGKLQADAKGYSLSSTEVTGIGTVFKFTAVGSHDEFPEMIPSQAVDKLLCGVVPGCPELVDDDFELIGNDREMMRIDNRDGLLSKIGLPNEQRKRYRKGPYWWETHNELIILLCPFLPLRTSLIMGYYFPAWCPTLQSVPAYWEGRCVLWRRLNRRYVSKTSLEEVLRYYNVLETKYSDDFYWRYDKAIAVVGKVSKEKKGFLDDCRSIFDYTTEQFKRQPFALDKENASGQKRYLDLLGAHVCMSMNAVQKAHEKIAATPRDKRTQHALKKKYEVTSSHGYYVSEDVWEIAEAYVDSIEDGIFDFAEYLRDRDINVTDDQAEEAWWLLMLRAMVWGMSTRQVFNHPFGRPVPSSFYGNKTPVWIA